MAEKSKSNRTLVDSSQLRKQLSARDDLAILKSLVAVHFLLEDAIFTSGYMPDERWRDAIEPSSYGKSILTRLGLEPPYEPQVFMGLFLVFYGEDFLIDVPSSRLDLVITIISSELQDLKIRLPNMFGRELYDKFNELYPGVRLDRLPADQTQELLQGTSQGIFQVGSIVAGPLGLMEVQQCRFLPPPADYMLWHCTDVGCRATHEVELTSGESELSIFVCDLLEDISNDARRVWQAVLRKEVKSGEAAKPFSYLDIVLLIGDTIHGDERNALLASVMNGRYGEHFREILGEKFGKGFCRASTEDICSRLSDPVRHQLLYLAGDKELAEAVDACIIRKSINVPSTELRAARYRAPGARTSSEISSLGVRSSGSRPLLDMCALILNAYTSHGRISDLQWHMRSQGGAPIRSDLLKYLSENKLRQVVRDLVLSNRDITEYVLSAVGCKFDERPDPGLADRVLWKLGIDTPRYGEALPILKRRLEQFGQELLTVGTLEDERSRERVRSVGVNLFVSIEDFLQELLRYNIWLLAGDHLVDTEFRYDSEYAMSLVATTLGSRIGSGNATFQWSVSGENTLGVLLAYLSAASSWMKGVVSSEREPLSRSAALLPFYADDEFRFFPFAHTQLWADADYSSLKRYSDQFETIHVKIARSNLAAIRNGLDHQRDEASFPKMDAMLAFVLQFREALELSDLNLFYPKEFWLKQYVVDRYGRQNATYVDYSDRERQLTGPSAAIDVPLRRTPKEAILIAPCSLLGVINAELTFTFQKKSAHSEYWTNYPPRPMDAAYEIARIGAMDRSLDDKDKKFDS